MSRFARALAVALVVAAAATAAPAVASAPSHRTVTFSYTGSRHAAVGQAGVFAGYFGAPVTMRSGDTRAKVQATDASGRPVPVLVQAPNRDYKGCGSVTLPVKALKKYYVQAFAGTVSGKVCGVATQGRIVVTIYS